MTTAASSSNEDVSMGAGVVDGTAGSGSAGRKKSNVAALGVGLGRAPPGGASVGRRAAPGSVGGTSGPSGAGLGRGVAVGVGVGRGLGVAVGRGVGVRVEVGSGVGMDVAVGRGVGVGVAVGCGVGVGVGSAVGVAVGVGVRVGVGVGEAHPAAMSRTNRPTTARALQAIEPSCVTERRCLQHVFSPTWLDRRAHGPPSAITEPTQRARGAPEPQTCCEAYFSRWGKGLQGGQGRKASCASFGGDEDGISGLFRAECLLQDFENLLKVPEVPPSAVLAEPIAKIGLLVFVH